jgi:ABC-2 type transport system permease protein
MTTTNTRPNTTTTDATAPEAPSAVERPWQLVAGREISVKLRDKNFIMATVFTLVILIVVFGIQAFLENRPNEARIVVPSQTAAAIVDRAEQAGNADDAKLEWTTTTVADEAAALDLVRAGDADVALVPDDSGWRLVGDRAEDDTVATWVGQVVKEEAIARNATEHGATLEQLSAGSVVGYDLLDADAQDPGFARVVGLVFAFLFYMAALMFGMQIAQSVVEEKQSRIVEILAAAIPIQQLLLGKIVGNVIMAMAQLVLFLGVGLGGLAFSPYSSFVPAVAGAAGWFLVFFLVGFIVLAAMWAVAGALATRHEDLQSTSTPVTMVIMVVLFGGLLLSGTGQVIGSYVPLMSVVAMPIRLAAGTAAWWEPLVSLGVTAAAGVALVRVAALLYQRSVMQTGSRLTMRQAFRVQS